MSAHSSFIKKIAADREFRRGRKELLERIEPSLSIMRIIAAFATALVTILALFKLLSYFTGETPFYPTEALTNTFGVSISLAVVYIIHLECRLQLMQIDMLDLQDHSKSSS